MSYLLSTIGNDQFLDSNGNPLAGGKLFTYLTGTSTKVATFTDNTGGVNQTNPIILNASGFPTIPIYLDSAVVYKFVLAPATDGDPPTSIIYTWNDVKVLDATVTVYEQWAVGTTPTFASTTSFTLVGDQTAIYHIGRRVKLQSTIATLSGIISASVFSSVTTVTVVLDTSVLDATLNAVWYSILTAVNSSVPGMSSSGVNTIITGIDSRTNSVATPLEIRANTSGTPAAGIGTGILLRAQSADETPSDFGQLDFSASDTTAASEDTYFRIWLRVAGAALTECYRWVATGAFKAIFTHANTADRTYTLQNSSDVLVMRDTTETLTNKTLATPTINNAVTGGIWTGNSIGTGALKTATGSASGTGNGGQVIVTANDYSFAPNVQTTFDSSGPVSVQGANQSDSGTTALIYGLLVPNGTSYVMRWRYFTASDNPVMWVAYDPLTGIVRATWASDDPTPDDVPGVIVPGCTSVRLTARDLESFTALSAMSQSARDYIRDRNLKPQHEAYRALQLLTGDAAPSSWFLKNCRVDMVAGKLRMKTPQERQ